MSMRQTVMRRRKAHLTRHTMLSPLRRAGFSIDLVFHVAVPLGPLSPREFKELAHSHASIPQTNTATPHAAASAVAPIIMSGNALTLLNTAQHGVVVLPLIVEVVCVVELAVVLAVVVSISD